MENNTIRVRKRSGVIVDFDISKIKTALRKAFDSMSKPVSEDAMDMIALRVLSVADDKIKDGILNVEDIQNAAEIVLIQTGFVDVAKAYMEYRQKHQEIRDVKKTELNYAKLVDEYLGQDDWRVKENSTVTYTLGGLILSNSGAVTANYWLSQVYDQEIADAHRNADIHIHDLSMLSPYCAGWSLKQLIKEGLGGVQGRISSTPASHLSTLCNQMVNFLGCTQNEWAGAQAFSSFDTYLAPFVKADNLSYKEVKQAIQSFVFGVNTPSRWGCQAPFTNVTIDWTVPDDLKNLKAIVGGKEADFTYGDCKKEMDMVNKAFLEIFLEGDANGRGFQYPIPTYSITKDFDWSETENNKLLFDLTAKYGTPYFSNYINSSMNPSDCRSMCPLTSDTEILVKNSRDGIVVRKIGTLYDGYNLKKTNYLFWNGHKWVSGHPVQMPMTPVFKIVLSNGTTVKMGENHLQPTKDRGTLKASDLEVGDWLPFNKTPIETERLGDSDLGFAIGAYAGDGSHDEGAVVYSLNVDVDQDTVSRLTAFWNRVGYPVKTTVSEKVEYVRVDKNPFAIVSEYIDGDALTKKLSNRCFNASNEFKEGFISGLRASDGSKEKKRIYTSSETMKNDVMKLLASMGHKALSNYIDNRESRLSDKPNYRIDFPDRERYGELFDQDDSYNYYKIVSIEKTNDASSDFLYCLEIDSDDHVFALASGLMTHNCRLRLDLRELRKRNGGFFGAGESTGCYDEKTYVFTNHGWKLFKDVDDNDEVCTLSPANEIEFHKPDKKFVYDYDGEMVKISGEKIDLLVTPNHRMLYCDRYTDEHKFVRADSITRENYKIPASGHWTGKDSEFFVLPGIDTEFRTGEYDNLHKIEWEPVKIKMTSWLKFLGMFISEGSFDNDECAATHGYRVFISQVKEETKAIFDEALKELPFNYSYDGRAFVICNKQLWSYVRQFGLCYDKFIPDDIKELPSEKLKVLYDFLMYGDGSIRRKIESKRPNAIHQKVYYTVSEKLANDVREILIKIGCMSSVNVRQGRISEIKGRVITSASKQYEVCAYQGKNRYLTKRNIGKEKYTGKVYCCEVQNNTLLVKRNEKMCWCGNSIGVVTINMPRIGYLASDKDDFYKRLDHMMDICARSLEIKRKVVTDLYNRGLYPYSKRYLGDVAYNNHFSTIGLVGMNEACLNANWLKCDLTHKEAQDFTEEVLNHMRTRLSDYQEQYPGTLFNLEATPAESTCVSGDTSVWTDKGLKTVNEIMADKNLSILSYNESTNAPEFKKLADCWRTKEDAEVMKITFSNGDSVKVTPNHKMAKRFMTGRGANRKCWIEYVEAGTLKVGDRLFACHVFTKDSKSLGETYQEVECRLGKLGGNFPMHRLLAENYFGKIPEGFVVHHKDFDKKNNSKENLEVISDAEHRRIHENDEGRNFFRDVNGAGNPFYGKHHTDETKEKISETKKETKRSWYPNFRASMANKDTRKKMSDGNKGKAFEQFSRYMPECSTDSIVEKWKENKTIGQIARELGKPYTYSLVKSRLKHVGLLPNHQIAKIEFLSEREDVYDLEVEGNHNFFISGGADDAVLVHNCYRLAKHDKERYPDIITAGKAGETPYYTNSSHLPVGYTEDIFSALDVEDKFQTLYTSGTVFHAFLGQRLPNWQSCMKLVRKIAENYKLPYYTMSPTYSICPEHGYLEGEQWKCPYCGKETEVYSRITGYYRPVKNWNAGKAQEFHDRQTYVIGDSNTADKHSGCDGSCQFENNEFKADPKPGKVDHIMIFTSPTCPNCKMAKMLLDKAGIKYENIDAASNKELTMSFGITKAPTMLVPDGDSFDVYDNASQISGWIKESRPA